MLLHSLKQGGSASIIRERAAHRGVELPGDLDGPELTKDLMFPYQAFWHLRRGEARTNYFEIHNYARIHQYNDPEELVAILFAMDATVDDYNNEKRKAQQQKKSKGKGVKRGNR